MSARSRRQLLEDCVESNALLCPAHFRGANAGHVKRQGECLRHRLGPLTESNALLCPAHFPGANAGYIKEKGDAFSIDWDNVK